MHAISEGLSYSRLLLRCGGAFRVPAGRILGGLPGHWYTLLKATTTPMRRHFCSNVSWPETVCLSEPYTATVAAHALGGCAA